MKGIVCAVCGFISISGNAPEKCPACGVSKISFKEKEDAIKTAGDENNLTELEKKHIPVITIIKQCGLIPEECMDVEVKMGEIQHPMQTEHYISNVDFYIDKEFVARVILTAEKLNPAVALHIKVKEGVLTVVARCNIHGAWIKEVNL